MKFRHLARYAAQSLVVRLIIIGIVLILAGSTVRYLTLSSFLREDITAVVAEQQTALANYVARDIGHQLLLRRSRLEQMAASLPGTAPASLAHVEPEFAVSAPYEALFSAGLLMATNDGQILLDSTKFTWPDQAEAAFVTRRTAILSGAETLEIGRPIKVPGSGVAVLPMTVTLGSPGQPSWGTLTGFTYLYGPNFLGNLLQARLGQSGSGFLLISPKDKLFIAASNPAKVLTNTPETGINPLHDRAMLGYRGVGVTRNARGIEEISAIVSVPNTRWFLVSAIATSEALGTVQRVQSYLLRNTVVTIVLLMIILAILVTLLLRPLTLAKRKADQMSRGHAPLSPLPGSGKGEIGVLIGAFNRLLRKLNAQQRELANAANHDSLTGLPNRRFLTGQLQNALEAARQGQRALALLFIDLDQFKPVNDTLGHEAGDQVLRMVGQRLRHHVRNSDCVARLGGDEFVVLLTNLDCGTAAHSVDIVVSGLVQAFSTPFHVQGHDCKLGISVGGIISDGNDQVAELMHWADQLMYKAKARENTSGVLRNAAQLRQPSASGQHNAQQAKKDQGNA
jgi:diguanylate cyclase (GGDEF)-like protein